MIKTYEIQYKFNDELSEKGWRNSVIVVYDGGTSTDGATLQHALDCASEEHEVIEEQEI